MKRIYFMKHHKRRKLFYPPGILSLVLLPLFGFMKIADLYRSRTAPYHAIELSVCCPPPHYYYNPDGGETPTPESIKTMRIYKTFSLSIEPAANAIVLEQARQAYNDLKLNQDTINGVQFSFNDSTRWQDYITALDYCFEKWPPCFTPYENDIWATYVNIDTTNRPLVPGM